MSDTATETAFALGQIRGALEQMEKRGEEAHRRADARLRELEEADQKILETITENERKLSGRISRFGWTVAGATVVVAVELALMLIRGSGG